MTDVRCYNVAIMACGEAEQWKQAMKVFTEMQKRGVNPDETSYSAIIHSLGTALVLVLLALVVVLLLLPVNPALVIVVLAVEIPPTTVSGGYHHN